MRKLLRTQDILLLGLAGALDLFEEIRDPLNILSNSYKNMYGWVPRSYRRSNFNHLVWRNLKAGYIEKVIKGEQIFIRISSQGNKKITRDFPLLSLVKKPWDRKWRIVTFDIEEVDRKVREQFREKLKELSFGMLQESVFISPHDISQDLYEFIQYIGLNECVYIIEAFRIVVGDEKELARKVWKLNELMDEYDGIIMEAEKIIHLIKVSGRPQKLNKRELDLINELKKKYLSIVIKDPFLPKQLLPNNWRAEEAKIIMKNLVGQSVKYG